jgi:cytochrome c oxidase subunit II
MISSYHPILMDVFNEPGSSFWLPGGRSNFATDTDWAAQAILYVSLFFFAIVVGAMVIFTIKYRRRSTADKVSTVTHNTVLEIAWTLIPLLIVMWFFFVGFKGFLSLHSPPSDAIDIQVQAHQWKFNFVYPGGGESPDLYVPIGQPVRLLITSQDVTHAVYIPNFRVGQNAVPGRTIDIWFKATELSGPQGYPLYCTQYCGQSHSTMFATVYVLSQEDYNRKLRELSNVFKRDGAYVPYAQVGKTLVEANGCGTCHSIDGRVGTGPTWLGLWKRDHKFYSPSGYTLMASDSDEKWIAYIAESIVDPKAKIVDGFQSQSMSDFSSAFSQNAAATPKDGQEYYKYQKTLAVIEYMKQISQGDKYDPSKAPTFHEDSATQPATGAAATSPSASNPNGKP